MYSMRYMHRYDKDTTACTSKKQNYERGTPADFLTVFHDQPIAFFKFQNSKNDQIIHFPHFLASIAIHSLDNAGILITSTNLCH